MLRKEQRMLHKEQFKGEILAAAQELFSQEGYANFSMRKLAAKIKYSPTTIYLYFRDKDDLLFCICEELYAAFMKGTADACSATADPREALRLSLYRYIEIGLSNPEHYKAVFFTSPVVYGSPQEFMGRDTMSLRGYNFWYELVDKCMEKGQLRRMDIKTVVLVLWSAAHGLVTSIIYTKDFPMADTSEMTETLVEGLLKGLSA